MPGPFFVPVVDCELVSGAQPEVSVLANSIGYALAERGVTFTADDAIAAAKRIVDQRLVGLANPEDHEPDLDTLTRADLAELDGPAHMVARVLDEWNYRMHGVTSSHHGVGLFLDLLAAEGYRVTPVEVPAPISELLSPPTD